MRIEEVPFDHPDSLAMRSAQEAEIDEMYEGDPGEPGPMPDASSMTTYFVGYEDGQAVAGAGLRANGLDVEIKRMYVAPERRGTGASTQLLQRLEEEARQRGFSRIVLETGNRQLAAQRVYEREGYVQIPLFGYYVGSPISLCYAKPL